MTNEQSVDTSAEAINAECKHLAKVLGLGALTAINQLRALAAERDALKRENERHDTPAWKANEELNHALHAMRAERDRLAAENARMRAALSDLMTWFPNKPSPPEWRLPGGEYGADAAVAAARAALTGDALHD